MQNTPSIKITQSSKMPAQNPSWIFYDASKPLPRVGKLTYGLAETAPASTVFSTWGSGLEDQDGIYLERVTLVKLNTSSGANQVPTDKQKGNDFVALTKEDLKEVCKRDGDTPKPEVGSLAKGISGNDNTMLQYGEGRVTAVLEDVVVFMVKRAGGAVHPGRI